MTMRSDLHSAKRAEAQEGANFSWVNFHDATGSTFTLFMPSLEAAQKVADAFNEAMK